MQSLKRLMSSDWESARVIHKYEGEIFFKRTETEFTFEFGEITVRTTVTHPEDKKKKYVMDASFKEEDFTYVAYYQPTLILGIG